MRLSCSLLSLAPSSSVSVSNYHLYFLPLSAPPFGTSPHFIMAHAGLLLPTSSKLCAICHWGSVDEFLWPPLPLSPKNLIRSTQGPNHFLSLLDCIYRRSVALRSLIEHFIITLLLHLFIYILQYSLCQVLCWREKRRSLSKMEGETTLLCFKYALLPLFSVLI